MMQHKQFIDNWVESILANPVTKQPCNSDSFEIRNGVVDARVYLKNSPGYHAWLDGQDEYEDWAKSDDGYDNKVENHTKEIEYDKPVYDQFEISGDFLDCGGGVSTVREFLPPDVRSVSLDPYINAPFEVPKARFEAYKSLSSPLNFLAANAEFLPFRHQSFDWVHMRSMLDHVQVPDLCLKEAHRVLKPGGRFLCLEFSKVKNEILNKFYQIYFQTIPRIGKLVVGKSEPYEYLINSIEDFYSQKEFFEKIKEHNFTNVSYRNLSGGIVAIHSAWKV